jgi:redox-sensitive bicupin YhaK (pirin superfamily)
MVEKKAPLTGEALVDETLAESFPASDPPSWTTGVDAPERDRESAGSVELVLPGYPRDLGGGFSVRRALPSMQRRLIGPFIFFDHMGPARLALGEGLDVRPHPHIGLATVTYLFDGEIVHRDSLGSLQPIRPGDVNWMVAGRGVVHSERSSPEERSRGVHVHGIQTWLALPMEHEEIEPRFEHHAAAAVPHVTRGGVRVDVIAGTAFGVRSPVSVLSPTLYGHARLEAGARLTIDDEHDARAIYVVEGNVVCDGKVFEPGSMGVLRSGGDITIEARAPARVMVIGGARLAGDRHIYWNFVSSSKERIERAKDDWQKERFPTVPGDALERIPLPG